MIIFISYNNFFCHFYLNTQKEMFLMNYNYYDGLDYW